MDVELSWKDHIDQVITKIPKMTAKARHYLSIQTLKTIYNTMVCPYLTYSCIVTELYAREWVHRPSSEQPAVRTTGEPMFTFTLCNHFGSPNHNVVINHG